MRFDYVVLECVASDYSCFDSVVGKFHLYDLRVTVLLGEEHLSINFYLTEFYDDWGHTFFHDSEGYERAALFPRQKILELLHFHPRVTPYKEQIEKQLGKEGCFPYQPIEEESLIEYDFVKFFRKCKKIAAKFKVNYKILTFEELGYTSYNAVRLDFENGPIYILCNNYRVTFVKNKNSAWGGELDGYPLNFIDHEHLAREFSGNYRVYTVAELNEPFNKDEFVLDDFNKYSVDHWKPKKVGDFLFNYWD
ncbi:hypothetical protein H1D32_08465 [Anaerobacillus sp. CMMVII]|uniref:hypothetical protein n=1 Tax=Anaerobacillus sp. CMMVII TaxID=2755588 RepID=UPI0021B84A05|nr:hypothetical protein [Anaerobacillus sp. CMMVII]MCT8137786.1 hypothetical protein [Anaerobacillus sp. CMMVII]